MKPRVTDHAVMRWLERVRGIDFEAIRAEITTPDVCAAVAAGARSVIASGHTVVIENKVIITVLGPGMRPKPKRRVPRELRAELAE